MQAGDLRERFGFYKRPSFAESPDLGSVEGEFPDDPEFSVSANVRPKLGGEGVLAGRLTGTNLVNVTVRYSISTVLITTDWRCRDERSQVIYNIRSIINPDQKKQWLELLCERGGVA